MNPVSWGVFDIILSTSVEKSPLLGPVVSEAIPLGATLGVEDQYIIVDCTGKLVFHDMLKGRPPKAGSGHAIERPIR